MPKINIADLDMNSEDNEIKPTKKEKITPKKMKPGVDNKPKQTKKK
jgi:hypothetical protein